MKWPSHYQFKINIPSRAQAKLMSWNTLHVVISGQDLRMGSKPSSKDSPNNETMWVTVFYCLSVSVLATQSCLILCNPMDYSLPGSFVHGILQTRILEWVTIPFSRGSSRSRDRTQVLHIAGRFFIIWATKKAQDCSIYYWKHPCLHGSTQFKPVLFKGQMFKNSPQIPGSFSSHLYTM